ncbi:MAG: ATP-binding protein [Crocinitomicaceae bacterium]|nr:ATP-binding protein [Crocinitomicaceae bacterium]
MFFILSFSCFLFTGFTNRAQISTSQKKAPTPKPIMETTSFRREFLANLAHELKTPLFSIQGYLLTLLEGAMENPETNKRFLKKAAKATERMTSLIKDLDYITRFEVNRIKIDKTIFSIEDLFKEVIESLEEQSKEKSISIQIKSKDSYLLVRADRNKISQAITNLLINSIVYNNEGGETLVNIYKKKKTVIITIKDNGPGIEEEHLPRLFERFYRVEKSRDRNKGGSGIGLSIVKHIIDSHKQTVIVDSHIGKGTIFTFTLDFSNGIESVPHQNI